MKNIEIIFLDIDGTIRNSDSVIEDVTKDAIKRARAAGLKIVLCTGRSCKYAKRVAKELDLDGYLISSNGAEVINLNDNSIIYNADISYSKIEKVYNFCQRNKLNFLMNTIEEDYQTINESYNRVCINNLEEIKNPINQIVITSYNYNAMMEILNSFYTEYENIRISGCANGLKVGDLHPKKDYYIDINRNDSSKANGVLKLLNYLEISPSNALACGDGINDYEMLQAVGIGVAMGNGLKELKEVADYITKTNDEYGVAYLIDKILQEKEC